MGKVIAISNQKGGVGKTASAVSLIAGLGKRGYKVLGIDLDPQGHLSNFMGVSKKKSSQITIYDVLRKEAKITEAIQKTSNGLVVPSNVLLAGAEQEFSSTGKEHKLHEVLEEIRNKYDFIIIDTSPALGVLTTNAFTAADYVLIPVDSDEGSIDGLVQLNNTIQTVKKYCNRNISILGIFFNVFNDRTKLGKTLFSVTEEIAANMGTKLFKTFIRRSEVMPQSRALKLNIFDYKADSTVAQDYSNLIDEMLQELGLELDRK